MKASDPSNEEPFAAAPVQLDPEFGPNASRRSSEERRRAHASGDRELGLIGPETSPQQLRRLPLELPSDWLRMGKGRFLQSDAANVLRVCGCPKGGWAHCLPSGKPQWTPCGRSPRTPLGCWRSPVCSSFRRSSVLCRFIPLTPRRPRMPRHPAAQLWHRCLFRRPTVRSGCCVRCCRRFVGYRH
jgi:hypothetical protein